MIMNWILRACSMGNVKLSNVSIIDITYLLTYSMVQSPSWAANWFAASQEIPRFSRNPKVHYRTHKCPPPVSILGQPNPVHIPTSHHLEIHPIIIHPSTPRSPQSSLSLRFPHQDPIHHPLLTHTRHMPSPSHAAAAKRYRSSDLGVTKMYLSETKMCHLCLENQRNETFIPK